MAVGFCASDQVLCKVYSVTGRALMPFKDQRVFAVAKVGVLGKKKNWNEGNLLPKAHGQLCPGPP